MSNIMWTANEDSLTVYHDGKRLLIVGPHKVATALRILEGHGGVEESDLDRIRDLAEPVDEHKAVVPVGTTYSDADVVRAMSDGGVPNVTYGPDGVAFNGEPIRGSVGRHLARVIERNGNDPKNVNWGPIAKFFGKLSQNSVSTENLFHWLSVHDFSIASDGRIIAYRGVGNAFRSGHAGVGGWIDADGTVHHDPETDADGYNERKSLVYAPGSTVFMRREDCNANGNVGCGPGLHFGTRSFAQGWNRGHMLLVLVDPADVVSVPTESYEKARCCRMEVVGTITDDVLGAQVVEVSRDGDQVSATDVTNPANPLPIDA